MRKELFWLVSSVFFMMVTILCWLTIQFHQHYQSTPPHHLLGNKPSAVAALKEQGFPFSFLVIGDTSGSETTETLIEMATRGVSLPLWSFWEIL